jgi:hypothetical protein
MSLLKDIFAPQAPEAISGTTGMPGKLQNGAKAFLEIAASVLGLSYIAGFLVTYTFQNRLGIHDANLDLLRIRYMHTGLLCLAFPLFVATPIAAHLWMIFEQKSHKKGHEKSAKEGKTVGKSHFAYNVQLLCITGTLYVYVLFEPYGEFHAHLVWIVLLLALVILQLTLANRLVGFTAKDIWISTIVRYTFALISIGLFCLCIKGTFGYLEVIIKRALSYWIFVLSLAYYLAFSLPADLHFWYRGQKEGIYLARWALIATLSILTILTFAFRVYPYIPADKGGGNFKYSRNAVICVSSDGTLPDKIRDAKNPGCSVPMKLIELTDSIAYAARVDDPGKTEDGQAPPRDGVKGPEGWSDGYFPTVYAISRGKIAYIDYSLSP